MRKFVAATAERSAADAAAIAWLLDGDPAIRWQAMRDLLAQPAALWEAERLRTQQAGWGARFLEALGPDAEWSPGRWTGTVWTLQTVMDCGLPTEHPQLREAAARFLAVNLPRPRAEDERWLLAKIDLCHLAFWLRIGTYFLGPEPRLASLADTILRAQMPDGGWNCRRRTEPHVHHGSFHTAFNVLEAL